MTSALISVLLMVLLLMSHSNIVSVKSWYCPEVLRDSSEGLAHGVGAESTGNMGNASFAFTAPLCEVQCCRSGKSAYFLKMKKYLYNVTLCFHTVMYDK